MMKMDLKNGPKKVPSRINQLPLSLLQIILTCVLSNVIQELIYKIGMFRECDKTVGGDLEAGGLSGMLPNHTIM